MREDGEGGREGGGVSQMPEFAVCVCVFGEWSAVGGHRQLAGWHTKGGTIRSSLFCGQIFSPISFVWLVWVAAHPDKGHFV